jgi:hypothetical protein
MGPTVPLPVAAGGVRRRRPAEATSEVGILKFEEILVFFLGVPLNPHEIAIKSPLYSPHLSVPANLPGVPLRGVEEGVVARCRQLFLWTLHGVAQDGLKGGTKGSQHTFIKYIEIINYNIMLIKYYSYVFI